MRIEAEAKATATRLAAEADAEATRTKARVDAEVTDMFAREMEMRRMEVARVRAFGNKVIFVPTDAAAPGVTGPMVAGMAAGIGSDVVRK